MARKEAIFKMKLDSDDAVSNVKKLDKDFTNLRDTIEVDVSGSISAMEDRLYELATAGQTNTKEFKKLQKQTADYKKVVIETDRSIDALAEQGRGLNTALSLAEGTVAGFQAFTGVSALLGDENEELLETITKLQAAQGVLNSISLIKQQIQNNGILLTNLQTKAQLGLNLAVGKGSKIMKVFRGALVATGIGALIVGIGMLIANFDKVRDFVGRVIKKFKSMGDGFKTVISILLPFIGVIRLVVAGLEKLGIIEDDLDRERTRQHKAQMKRLKKEGQELDAILDKKRKDLKEFTEDGNFRIRMMQAQGASKEELFQAEQKLRKETIRQNIALGQQLQARNALTIAERDALIARGKIDEANKLDDKVKERNKEIRALNKVNRDFRKDIKVEDAKFKTEIENKEEKHQEKLTSIRRDARNKEKAEIEAHREVLRDIYTIDLSPEQKALDARMQLFDKQRNAIKALYTKGVIDKEQFELAKLTIEKRFQAESIRMSNEALALSKEEDAQRMASINAEIEAIENAKLDKEEARIDKDLKAKEEAAAKEKKIAESVANFKNDVEQKSFALALDLVNVFAGKSEASQRRAFNMTKAISIAQATIDTYKSANAIFASTAASPVTALNPAAPFIAAGLAVGAGLANVAKIASQKFQGGGGGAGGGGGSVAKPNIQGASAGSFSSSDNTNNSQSNIGVGGGQDTQQSQAPTKVYVTEQDITDTQNKVKTTEAISTF